MKKKLRGITILLAFALICFIVMSFFRGIDSKTKITEITESIEVDGTTSIESKTVNTKLSFLPKLIVPVTSIELALICVTSGIFSGILCLLIHGMVMSGIFCFLKYGAELLGMLKESGHHRIEREYFFAANIYGKIFILVGTVIVLLYIFEIISRIKNRPPRPKKPPKPKKVPREDYSGISGIDIPESRE